MFCTIFVFAPVRLFLNVKIQPLISSSSILVIAMTFDVLGALEGVRTLGRKTLGRKTLGS